MIKLEINGVTVEVDDSFAQMTPEQQNATVEEIARSLPQGERGFMRGTGVINEGIARGFGAPVDLVAAGLNRIGIDTGDAPIGGSESIRRAMEGIGANPNRRDPEGIGEALLMGAGEAAGMLLPMTAAARLAQGTGAAQATREAIMRGPVATSTPRTVGQNFADNVMTPFVNTPSAAITAEMAAGAGGRAAQEWAEGLPDNGWGDVARAVAPIAGGLVGGTAPSLARRAAVAGIERTPVAGTALMAARAAVTPFMREGAFVRAADRVRTLAADPEAAAAAMRGENTGNLTPAQMTRDPNLLALERTAMEENPTLREEILARRQQSQDALTQEMRAPAGDATTQDAQAFLAERQAVFREGLQRRVAEAEERARERVMALDPARRESENSIIVREELDRAYEAAARQENALWMSVPRTAEVPVDFSRETFNTLVEETARAQRSDIPQDAFDLLGPADRGGFGDTTTVRELHGLYSKMRRMAREAMGQTVPNENRARIANRIADAILQDLGATGGLSTEVGRKINQARAFSAELNATFGQGEVGPVLSSVRSGGDRVAPEATLLRTVGKGGVLGANAVRDIRRATDMGNENNPTLGANPDPAMQDFLQGRLMDTAAPRGVYDPRRAEDFVRANREILQQFPELQGNIGAANMATRDAQARASRVSDIVARLDDRRQTVTTAFLRATPGNEIAQAVFQTQRPVEAAANIARAARRDATGKALAGLKAAFLDDLIGGALQPVTAEGTRPISGGALVDRLTDPTSRGALARVFSQEELSRMDRLAQAFQGLQVAREAGTLNALIEDSPNAMIEVAGRVLGARVGAMMGNSGGSSLQSAQIMSSRVQRILRRLTNDTAQQLLRDAITDRDLFVALLMKQQTPSARRRVENRLTEWALGVGAISLSDLAREDNQEQAQ